jgi:hypothetical protein
MNAGKISVIAVLFSLLSFSILPNSVLAIPPYSGGSGEANDPYRIGSAVNLLYLGTHTGDYGKNFILIADINLAASGPFTTAVIAPDTNNSAGGFQGVQFSGVFDGNGHTISNLTIDSNGAGNDYLGLFGRAYSGEIKNLGLEDVNIAGDDNSIYLGGLAGYIYDSNISNCYSTGNVSGGDNSDSLGGLVGSNYYGGGGSISDCHSTGNVTGGDGSQNLGGLVGDNTYIISNCFSSGAVTGGDNSLRLGGLVGFNNDSIISDCYSTGTVSGGNNSSLLGGLVGLNGGDISDCYSTGNVSGGDSSYYLGGLVGYNNGGNISNCFSSGAVTGTYYLGGLVGDNDGGTISNCYSTGDISGTNYLGGLVGSSNSSISNCYSTGDISGTNYLGGLVGANSGSINRCYFLDTEPNNGLGTPLTDAKMKQQKSFVGWDFIGETINGPNDVWWINKGVSYPKLYWQPNVTQCTVTAGSKVNSDKISFSGTMGAKADDFNDANTVKVTIDSNDIVSPCALTFPIDANTFKKGKYNYSKTVGGVKKSFTYDVKTHKFSFAASNVDLSGLGCPVTIEIEVGGYYTMVEIDEVIVNGPSVPIPILLMMGVKDVLRVDKCQVQQGKDPNSDKLTAGGAFAVEDADVIMADYDLVFTLGTQTFTLPAGSLKPGKGIFSCSKAPLTEGGTADVAFNFNLCSFTLTIKNTEITADPGTIDFGFNFAGFDEKVQIVLEGSAILQGAVDYTGSYPEPNTVSYIDNGETVNVPAYPGQVVVFFKTPVSESSAQALFAAAGGTILAKIPNVGYYLVAVAVGGENAFISAVSADARVSLAAPNMIGVRGSRAILLEGCGDAHYTGVRAAFINNGGLSDQCRDIYNGGPNESPFHKIVVEILKEANLNGKGATLINLSSYGTLRYGDNTFVNGDNWEDFFPEDQQMLQDAWYKFMAVVLNAIAALPAEYRENLVLTVCAGNNNMPVCSGIARLRTNPRFAEVLKNNVLIVSTTSMPGNYCTADPNVAVRNNAEAADGTSYATPAALALIQNIMRLSGVSAREALQAVKRAVAANPDHRLIPSEAINQTQFTLSTATTGTGSGTVNAFPMPNGPGDTYIVGTMVTLTATAYTGSTFTGWSGDVTGTAKTVKIRMDGNKSASAAFAKSTAAVKYVGSFTGSTTSGMLGCFWLHTVSGTGTITIASTGAATFKVSGTDHLTVLPGSDPACKGSSMGASYSGSLTIALDGKSVSADVTNPDGSVSFDGTINEDNTITGTLTIDAYVFDSPIVGPLTLNKQ